MKQTYTSRSTSINSAKLPAVFRKASLSAPLLLDYGCGRYTDHIRKYVEQRPGAKYLPFDPFNQPDTVNAGTLQKIRSAVTDGIPVDVVCSNVLNVIDDDDTVRQIAGTITDIVSRSGGTAYVTVYEGDRSGIGRQTGTDQYQRNAPLRDYLQYFDHAAIHRGMIIVTQNNS